MKDHGGMSKRNRETAAAERRVAAEREREKVPVFRTNATRTSGGTGPGVVRVPGDEAGRLVADRLAVHGERPPRS